MFRASEEPDIDVLRRYVCVDHASDDDLAKLSDFVSMEWDGYVLTVGNAIPYATFFTTGAVLPSAGLATEGPAYLYITTAERVYKATSVS